MTPTPSLCTPPIRALAVVAVVAVVVTTVIVAGCGGGSPSSASVSGAAAAQGGPGQAAFAFSSCMRHHGVTNFPDPKVKTSANGTSVAIGINPSISGQPAFKTAQAACQHILPKPDGGPDGNPAQRRARTQALIAFARCLRSHGFPNFPDPDANGELSQEMIRRSGINFQTPALLTTGRQCAAVTHGAITPAQVAQAISHANASGGQTATTP